MIHGLMGVGCKRIRLRLPEGMSEGDVREYERDLKLSAKTFEATAKATAISTVDDLFPDYLSWYKLHRAFYLCLYLLGLRFAEARMLKPGDLDIPGIIVFVKQKGSSYKI